MFVVVAEPSAGVRPVTRSSSREIVRGDLARRVPLSGSGDEFGGFLTRRTGGLVARSATARELIRHPLVMDTVERVLVDSTTSSLEPGALSDVLVSQGPHIYMRHVKLDPDDEKATAARIRAGLLHEDWPSVRAWIEAVEP